MLNTKLFYVQIFKKSIVQIMAKYKKIQNKSIS